MARGSWSEKAPVRIYGGGHAPEALEAALWCFHRGHGFRDAVLAAVNLGGDADATAAITGQLAGAHHGVAGIPPAWRGSLALQPTLLALADGLLEGALKRISA